MNRQRVRLRAVRLPKMVCVRREKGVNAAGGFGRRYCPGGKGGDFAETGEGGVLSWRGAMLGLVQGDVVVVGDNCDGEGAHWDLESGHLRRWHCRLRRRRPFLVRSWGHRRRQRCGGWWRRKSSFWT